MYLQWRIWVVYAVLFGLAIPWYWRFLPIDSERLWIGMPVWATSAVVGSLAISLFTAWLLSRRWPQESGEADVHDDPHVSPGGLNQTANARGEVP
jgi:hypothetical protein